MEEKINEAIEFLKSNGYCVYKYTESMNKDADECDCQEKIAWIVVVLFVWQEWIINMAREFSMCEVCKLDKDDLCNYDCIKKRSDCLFRFVTCNNFIYDDDKPITNAERISTLLKTDINAAVLELNKVYFEDLEDWLKQAAIIEGDL